jgi:hypothetical protein
MVVGKGVTSSHALVEVGKRIEVRGIIPIKIRNAKAWRRVLGIDFFGDGINLEHLWFCYCKTSCKRYPQTGARSC